MDTSVSLSQVRAFVSLFSGKETRALFGEKTHLVIDTTAPSATAHALCLKLLRNQRPPSPMYGLLALNLVSRNLAVWYRIFWPLWTGSVFDMEGGRVHS